MLWIFGGQVELVLIPSKSRGNLLDELACSIERNNIKNVNGNMIRDLNPNFKQYNSYTKNSYM